MEKLTIEERYNLFKDAFSHCGLFLLEMEDKDMMYHLFEEFDTDAISFLHPSALEPLKENGYINDEIACMCTSLREMWHKLESSTTGRVEEIRSSPDWIAMFHLADEIHIRLTRGTV